MSSFFSLRKSCPSRPPETLYLISTLDDEDKGQFLRVDTTRKEVADFIKPPVEKPEEPTADQAKLIRAAKKLLGLEPLTPEVLEAVRDIAIDNCTATTDKGVDGHTARVEAAFNLLNTHTFIKAVHEAVKPDKPVKIEKEKLIEPTPEPMSKAKPKAPKAEKAAPKADAPPLDWVEGRKASKPPRKPRAAKPAVDYQAEALRHAKAEFGANDGATA